MNEVTITRNTTALHVAVENRLKTSAQHTLRLVEVLVAAGADKEIQDDCGLTPLRIVLDGDEAFSSDALIAALS